MEYIIEMLNITKQFPGIIANDDISLQLKKGEIHALLGENGAGKSTLMSVLFGLYRPEKGKIFINGTETEIKNPNDANKYGIGMVHQHFKLVENFTVLENIILGVEETKAGVIKTHNAKKKVSDLCAKYNLNVDLESKVSDISVGMQQKVEILKMLFRENNVLIFDEPTAVLTPYEIEELLHIMKILISEGKSILFITHKLNEIKKVADRCTILRKGKYIGTVNVSSTSVEELSRMMVGRDINLSVKKDAHTLGDVILEVKNLYVKNLNHQDACKNISFNVKKGEIVCIAGIEGNGQSELVRAITGLSKIQSGQCLLDNTDITNISIRKRNLLGISHIPEDRHKHGLILDFTLDINLALKSYFKKEFCKNGFLIKKKFIDYGNKLSEKYDIRSGQGINTVCRSMSGGNQQKAIVAREIEEDTDLLIAVQPTRGLDVGAIEYIHKRLVDVRNKNKAVLLVSYELDEVISLADRIIVFYEGEIVGEFVNKDIDILDLGLYMAGNKRTGGTDESKN